MSKWIEEELEPGLRVSYGLNDPQLDRVQIPDR